MPLYLPQAEPEKVRLARAQQRRNDIFGPITDMSLQFRMAVHSDVKCGWLACAALAVSYVCDAAVTVEDILRTNRMSLFYVSLSAVTLAELFDSLDEFTRTYAAQQRQLLDSMTTEQIDMLEEAQFARERKLLREADGGGRRGSGNTNNNITTNNTNNNSNNPISLDEDDEDDTEEGESSDDNDDDDSNEDVDFDAGGVGGSMIVRPKSNNNNNSNNIC